jgi:hypothetical protein
MQLLLSTICIFGFLTNLTNIAVLMNHRMKNISFKYLLATSLSDLFYLSLSIYCPENSSYFTQVYFIYIGHYFTSCLAIFIIFTDITLSLIRYSILKNKTYLQSLNYYLVSGCLFLISLIYYSPVVFFFKIQQIKIHQNITLSSMDGFKVEINSFGSSMYGKIIPIILSSIRIILAMFVLTSINIMNIIEFRKRYSKRLKQPTFDISESIT